MMVAQLAKLTAPARATRPIQLRALLLMFVDVIPRAMRRHHMGGSLMEGSRRGELAGRRPGNDAPGNWPYRLRADSAIVRVG